MATVFERNHDSGPPLSSHYTVSDPNSALSISANAALNDTSYGVLCDWDSMTGTQSTLTHTYTALSGNDMRFRMRLNMDNVTHDGGGFFVMMQFDVKTNDLFRIQIDTHGTANRFNVLFRYRPDSSGFFTTAATDIMPTGEVCLDFAATRETSDGAADGTMDCYVNGVLLGSVSNIDNFNRWASITTFRQLYIKDPLNSSGDGYVDEVILDDDSSTVLCASTTPFRFLGFDADNGTLLVTGLNNAATLQLFEYTDLASLTESGTTSFGSATDTELDNLTRGIFPVVRPEGDGIWYLFGRDGNDVQAQYNDNSGTLGWVNIGPGTATWGTAKYAVALMPAPFDPDDVIIAFDDDDIYRARYGTATWVKMGDATSGLRTAVRHPIRFNELLAGGTAAGTVLFSHNFGVSWSDVSGTALGTINAFEVSL